MARTVVLAARQGGADRGRDAEDGASPGLMGKAELKPLLKLSRHRLVSCVVVLTKGRQGVVLLDKKVKPRKLAATLKAKAKAAGLELDPSTIRFGRASVDGSSDSARVVFKVHRDAPAAVGRAMLPLLRPVGFQRCEFVTDAALENEPEDGEDGAGEADEEGDEDGHEGGGAASPAGAGAGGAGQGAPGQAPTAVPPAPVPSFVPGPAAPAAASPPRTRVAGVVPPDLAEGIRAAVSADPSRKPELVRLLAQVRAGVDAGDPGAAERGVAALRQALDGPVPAPAREGRAAEDRATGGARPVPALAGEPEALATRATTDKLAGLARAWKAQQGQAGAAGPVGASKQGGPKAPAPPASKSAALPAPSGGDEGLVTPVLSKQPWAPPPAAPPVPPPAPSGQLPPGLVPEVQGPSPLPGGRTVAREGLRAGGHGVGRFLVTKPNPYLMVAGAVLLVAMELMPRADESGGEATVTLRQQGEGGQPGREVAKLHMDPTGSLRAEAGGRGAVLGQMDPSGRITLTPTGEAHLAEQAKGAPTPPVPAAAGTYDAMGDWTGPGTPDEAASQLAAPGPADAAAPPRPGTPGLPQEPAPGQGPQQPAWLREIEGIETHDADEREFIEGQAQGGMRHADIVRALEERRRGGGGTARGQGGAGGSGLAVPGQPSAAQPPVNATGRQRLAAPVPNASSPAERHHLNRLKLNTHRKAKNTVILPGTDVEADLQAIREGKAMRDGPYYVAGDRYYELHEGGRLYPVQGPGFVLLDRGAFRALCILNALGDTPEAQRMLDNEGIAEDQQRTARILWGQR